jgi:hypothetical protein
MKEIRNKWLEITTLIIAVIALFFSWQANSIAQRQSSDKVLVLDVQPIGSDFYYEENISTGSCEHRIRLANLGGANASIVNLEAIISSPKEKFHLSGTGDATIKSDAAFMNLTDIFISFYENKVPASVFSPESYNVFNTESNRYAQLSIPMKIEGHATIDIYSYLKFHQDISVIPHGISFWDFNGDPPRELSNEDIPIEITYLITLSSGEQITSPKSICMSGEK